MAEAAPMSARCTCNSVRRTARILARTYDAALLKSGMNITQLAVLRAVLRHVDRPLSRLADELAMDRSSLYRALATCEKRGWLRLAAGASGRTRRAALTAKGRRLLRFADPPWATIQHAVLERFGQVQWRAFAAELERLGDCARAVTAK
jgi:DNA-binding MarR family transcriptional regulator